MTLAQIASLIAKKEAGKHSITVGDARQVVSILSDQLFEEFEALGYKETPKVPTLRALYLNGKKRAKKEKPVEPIKEDSHGDATQTQE